MTELEPRKTTVAQKLLEIVEYEAIGILILCAVGVGWTLLSVATHGRLPLPENINSAEVYSGLAGIFFGIFKAIPDDTRSSN